MGSKFNKTVLKKGVNSTSTTGKTDNVNDEQTKISVGAGLLSNVSKAAHPTEMEVIYVLPNNIHPSKDNTISMNEAEIEDLAESILQVGMINPPVIKKLGDDDFNIVCGERRWRATMLNIKNGHRDGDIPLKCHLFNPDLIDLPLSDIEKEDFVRDVENAQQRNKTDGDKLMLMRKFKARYELLRERDPEKFRGVKTRALLVEDMKMSPSSIAQFQKVENQGSKELKQAMIDGKVKISTAVDIASMPEDNQKELISQTLDQDSESGKKEITKKDVLKYEHDKKQNQEKKETTSASSTQNGKRKSEQEKPDAQEDGYTLVTDKSLKTDLKTVFSSLKRNAGIKLDDKKYFTYLKIISELEKLLK